MTAGIWLFQQSLPKDLISAVVYRAARSRRPWFKQPLIDWFARTYRVDLTEAEHTDARHYPTFNDFFTRALKPGARTIAPGERTVVSPADGVLTEFGTLDDDHLLQAKGFRYTLAELLGEDGPEARALRGGSYATIYLAPHNYHRVHAPFAGRLLRTRYLPGRRFSVSRATAAAIPRLFCRNERAACWFDTPVGPMVVVLVGALNVSSITTFNRGELPSGSPQHWLETSPPSLARGAELGRFNLGSTAIVLFGPGAIRWNTALANGTPLLMGAALAETLATR